MTTHAQGKSSSHKKEQSQGDMSLFWTIVNMLRGSLAPELEKLAKTIAAGISDDSPLRHPMMKRVLGAIAQGVEEKLDKGSPAARAAGGLGVDIVELVSSALVGDEAHVNPGLETSFLAEARKRLRTTKTEQEAKEMAAKILVEFALLEEIRKKVEEHTKKETTTHHHETTPWTEKLKAINDSWEADLDARDAPATQKNPDLLTPLRKAKQTTVQFFRKLFS